MKTTCLPLLLLPVLLSSVATLPAAALEVFAAWDFNQIPGTPEDTNAPPPSVGLGVTRTLGGVAAGLAAGDPTGSGGRGWNLSRFPAQGTGPLTAGARFAVSTAGWESLQLSFRHRFSARSSAAVQVRVSGDGVSFVPALEYTAPGADRWHLVTVPLDAIPVVADTAGFVVEIVAAFAAGTNRYAAAGPSSTYATSGTWRFDDVELSGLRTWDPPGAPRVAVPPIGQSLVVGQALRLGVGISGAEPLAYQWQFDGVDLPGETGPVLERDAAVASDAGRYRVVVWNGLGDVVSDEVRVSVAPPPPHYVVMDCDALHARVTGPDFAWPGLEKPVRVEGIVTTHASLATAEHRLFFLQDATGGVAVWWRGAGAAGEALPEAGSRVRVVGPVVQTAGMLRVAPEVGNASHSVTVLETGLELPEPVEFDWDWGEDPVRLEALEGRRVRVSAVTLDVRTPLFPGRGANLTLTSMDTRRTVVLRVEGNTGGAWVDLAGQPKPVGAFTVTGVWAQNDTSRPYTTGYHLVPTRFADLIPDGRPPEVEWTVQLLDLRRRGDAETNAFSEQVLRPGEGIRLQATFVEDQGAVAPSGEDLIPEGAVLDWGTPEVLEDGRHRLKAGLRWTATTAHAGRLHRIRIAAAGPGAVRRLNGTVYVPSAAEQGIVITEFFANPPVRPGAAGFNPLHREEWPPSDAGLAGRIASWDEFVELANLGTGPVDLGGWTLADATRTRAWMDPGAPTSRLPAGAALVWYGGPVGSHPPQLPVVAVPASLAGSTGSSADGLGLNNTGDTLVLRNAAGHLIERIVYTARQIPAAGTLVRWPLPEGEWGAQSNLDGGLLATPGLPPVGEIWVAGGAVRTLELRVDVVDGLLRLQWASHEGAAICDLHAAASPNGPWARLAEGLEDSEITLEPGDVSQFYQVRLR